jgi:hypothetical protein
MADLNAKLVPILLREIERLKGQSAGDDSEMPRLFHSQG